MVYSLSWEVTPNWSRFYPLGDEYRAYLTGIAEKYQLTDHLHFNSAVARMEWLDAEQVWGLTIFSSAGHTTRTVRAAAVITGAGHLNHPKYPDVEGRESFPASPFTPLLARVDLAGKRAAVIGVGAAGAGLCIDRAPGWASDGVPAPGALDLAQPAGRRDHKQQRKLAAPPPAVLSAVVAPGDLRAGEQLHPPDERGGRGMAQEPSVVDLAGERRA